MVNLYNFACYLQKMVNRLIYRKLAIRMVNLCIPVFSPTKKTKKLLINLRFENYQLLFSGTTLESIKQKLGFLMGCVSLFAFIKKFLLFCQYFNHRKHDFNQSSTHRQQAFKLSSTLHQLKKTENQES